MLGNVALRLERGKAAWTLISNKAVLLYIQTQILYTGTQSLSSQFMM